PQILRDQKRFTFAFVLAEIADRLAGIVLDITHFTIYAVLLGQAVEQIHRRIEVNLLGRRLADAQLPVFTIVAFAVVDQRHLVGRILISIGLQRRLQFRQALPQFLFALFFKTVAGDQDVYEHGSRPG